MTTKGSRWNWETSLTRVALWRITPLVVGWLVLRDDGYRFDVMLTGVLLWSSLDIVKMAESRQKENQPE